MSKERIVARLTEDRATAVQDIQIAKSRTKANAAQHGALNNSRVQLVINEDIKRGVGEYLDKSVRFINHVPGPSFKEHANELRDAAMH